jgi:PAS domain S-box-containing protein
VPEFIVDDALLRSALELSPAGIVISDAGGKIVFANRQVEQICGHQDGDLVGRSVEEILPVRYRTTHVAHRAAFLSDPKRRSMGSGRDFLALHKTGREVPVEIGLVPVTHGGEPFVIASLVDVTERRRNEEQLRWLSLAVDQSPTSVVMTNLAGDIEYVNRAFTDVTGYTLAEVRGRNPRILGSGTTSPDAYRDLWSSITAGRPWHGELMNRKKDGTAYWDAMWVYPIRDAEGRVTRFLALKEDITERKHTQATLADTASRLQALLEHANDGISVIDVSGIILEANHRLGEIVGRPVSDIVGRHIKEITSAASATAKVAEFAAVVARGAGTVLGVEIPRPDGKPVTVDFSLSTVTIGQERVVLSIGRDVTEQRSLEAQFRQAQKMEAVGRLAGGVAHDFNNVLTAVFGNVDLLREELADNVSAQEGLAEIRVAAERAADLTRQLLAFSRTQVLEQVVLGPNSLIADLEKMLRRVIGEDVELKLALGDAVGNLRADRGQLQQVIMNLVVNARDAMPTGGTIIIETANADLTSEYVDLHPPVIPGAYVMVAVSDTGAGMTPDVQARIFEPFFTTKERNKGTGLGLSTVYGIVKQSGGYIWVYSEPGRGTTFKIYLPRVDALAEHVTRTQDAHRTTGTETILLAEDDVMVRPVVKQMLERVGYTVLDAGSAEEALAVAEGYPGVIHLLVTDVVMPEASGRELARRLAGARPQTKVLFVSGYTNDAIVQHGMLEPGLNYLHKPLTPAALARKVREVLDGTGD